MGSHHHSVLLLCTHLCVHSGFTLLFPAVFSSPCPPHLTYLRNTDIGTPAWPESPTGSPGLVLSWRQVCWTACSPVDCSLPGTSVYEILQGRILEWAAMPRSPPGDLPDPEIKPRSPVSPALTGRFFTTESSGTPPEPPSSPT